jgi:hypothetical protein
MGTPKRVLKVAAILAIVHLFVTGVLMAVGIAIGYERFDTDEEPTTADKALGAVVTVLLQPVGSVFDALTAHTGRGIPDVLEWSLLLVNSAIWGVAMATIWYLAKRSNPALNADAQKRRAG